MRRGRFFILGGLGALALVVLAHCGDGGGSSREATQDTSCPAGTTFAYRDGDIIACNTCASDADCKPSGHCETVCGPDCENDHGGCCGVRECVELR